MDVMTTKSQIIRSLNELPPESLATVAEFVEFLRTKNASSTVPTPRLVKLGGVWQGYHFDEQDIRAARREVWANLGRGFDG